MRIYTIIILVICSFFPNAQIIKGKLISSIDKQAVPFARLGLLNENFGVISDEEGNFSIDLTDVDKNKELVVEVAGFNKFKIKVDNFINSKNYTITIQEKIQDIQEVVLLNKKSFKRKNWGTNAKSKSILFAYYPERNNEDTSKEIAVYFGNSKKIKIEKIKINISELKTDTPLILNFNIYAKNDKFPAESLTSQTLSTTLTADKIIDDTFSFDISDKNIWIDKEDFYVSLQVANNFKGHLFLSGAFFNAVYIRHFYSPWEKIVIAGPSLNIDVKILK
jgi:hypothetical protein